MEQQDIAGFQQKKMLLFLSCFLSCTFAYRPIGIHFDIEPHGLPEWSAEPGKSSLANQYLDLLVQLKTFGSPLPITMDVAMEYSVYSFPRTGSGTSQLFLTQIFGIIDDVTLMDYRDFAISCPRAGGANCPVTDSILSHGKASLDIAESIDPAQKHVNIGVETNLVNPGKVTFYEEGEYWMEIALNETQKNFSSYSSFHGLAIEDITGYSASAFLNQSLSTNKNGRFCRHAWLWDTDFVLSKNGKTPSQLVTFALSHGIDAVMVDSYWMFTDLRATFTSFIQTLGSNGIGVELLFGDATWTYTANHAVPIGLVNQSSIFYAELPAATITPHHCSPIHTTLTNPSSSSTGGTTGSSSTGGTTGSSSSSMPSSPGFGRKDIFNLILITGITFLLVINLMI